MSAILGQFQIFSDGKEGTMFNIHVFLLAYPDKFPTI